MDWISSFMVYRICWPKINGLIRPPPLIHCTTLVGASVISNLDREFLLVFLLTFQLSHHLYKSQKCKGYLALYFAATV